VRDYREAAESAEKLADKSTEIRALTLFRWRVTGAVTVVALLAGVIVELLYGSRGLWSTVAAVSLALATLDRRRDGVPGRKAVLTGPRTLTWTMDPQAGRSTVIAQPSPILVARSTSRRGFVLADQLRVAVRVHQDFVELLRWIDV
jgi:hypothetical protein